MREGNFEAPTRHPLDWKNPDFHDEASAFKEMERVFEICHGCRRCVSLCQSFPNLFDLVDTTDDGAGPTQRFVDASLRSAADDLSRAVARYEAAPTGCFRIHSRTGAVGVPTHSS